MSTSRELYKLKYPPTEAEFQALLDAIPFKDEDTSSSLNFFKITTDVVKEGTTIEHDLGRIPVFVGFKKNNQGIGDIFWMHAAAETPENLADDAHMKLIVAPSQNIDALEITIICI